MRDGLSRVYVRTHWETDVRKRSTEQDMCSTRLHFPYIVGVTFRPLESHFPSFLNHLFTGSSRKGLPLLRFVHVVTEGFEGLLLLRVNESHRIWRTIKRGITEGREGTELGDYQEGP